MKRIKAACVEQIIVFRVTDPTFRERAIEQNRQEFEYYKRRLERTGGEFKIFEEEILPDGSLQVRVKKQYNASPIGELLN